jgi:hypothetical protein
MAISVVSPIHTSSHYQTFETPFLHELVGGDRNMEQTNLVVTPDGKTWDEVTRDVGYIGSDIHKWHWITNHITDNTLQSSLTTSPWVCRGTTYGHDFGNKNFALAYDRHICLKDGKYEIYAGSYMAASWGSFVIKINGITVQYYGYVGNVDYSSGSHICTLKRGDYVQISGGHVHDASNLSTYYIKRLEG